VNKYNIEGKLVNETIKDYKGEVKIFHFFEMNFWFPLSSLFALNSFSHFFASFWSDLIWCFTCLQITQWMRTDSYSNNREKEIKEKKQRNTNICLTQLLFFDCCEDFRKNEWMLRVLEFVIFGRARSWNVVSKIQALFLAIVGNICNRKMWSSSESVKDIMLSFIWIFALNLSVGWTENERERSEFQPNTFPTKILSKKI
jgi:hypothetical protein